MLVFESSHENLSFTQEWIFVFKSIVLLQRLKFACVKNYIQKHSCKFLHSFEVWIFYWKYSSWEFLSFTQEWMFVFKLIVLHKKLTLLEWRITFRSNLAEKVFVLFWGLNILLRRILRLNWVFLSYWKDWFFSNTVNYTEFQFILFYLFLHTINRI